MDTLSQCIALPIRHFQFSKKKIQSRSLLIRKGTSHHPDLQVFAQVAVN
jgi:hypothetical protein